MADRTVRDTDGLRTGHFKIRGATGIPCTIEFGRSEQDSINFPTEYLFTIAGQRVAARVDVLADLANLNTTNLNDCLVIVLGHLAKTDGKGAYYIYFSTGRPASPDEFYEVTGPGTDDWYKRWISSQPDTEDNTWEDTIGVGVVDVDGSNYQKTTIVSETTLSFSGSLGSTVQKTIQLWVIDAGQNLIVPAANDPHGKYVSSPIQQILTFEHLGGAWVLQ